MESKRSLPRSFASLEARDNINYLRQNIQNLNNDQIAKATIGDLYRLDRVSERQELFNKDYSQNEREFLCAVARELDTLIQQHKRGSGRDSIVAKHLELELSNALTFLQNQALSKAATPLSSSSFSNQPQINTLQRPPIEPYESKSSYENTLLEAYNDSENDADLIDDELLPDFQHNDILSIIPMDQEASSPAVPDASAPSSTSILAEIDDIQLEESVSLSDRDSPLVGRSPMSESSAEELAGYNEKRVAVFEIKAILKALRGEVIADEICEKAKRASAKKSEDRNDEDIQALQEVARFLVSSSFRHNNILRNAWLAVKAQVAQGTRTFATTDTGTIERSQLHQKGKALYSAMRQHFSKILIDNINQAIRDAEINVKKEFELQDNDMIININEYLKGIEIHHIRYKAQQPRIAATTRNLVLLNRREHTETHRITAGQSRNLFRIMEPEIINALKETLSRRRLSVFEKDQKLDS